MEFDGTRWSKSARNTVGGDFAVLTKSLHKQKSRLTYMSGKPQQFVHQRILRNRLGLSSLRRGVAAEAVNLRHQPFEAYGINRSCLASFETDRC